MSKKYEMTNEYIEFQGAKLYRITALKDFADVKAGDKGGYVQHEDNLSQDGNCWVYNNAKVFGSAAVFGSAKVYGYAKVSGSAQVCGNAEVYGNAQVCGNARVHGYAQIKGDQIIQGGIYNLPKHTPQISKGENKMSRLKELEKMWDEYCKASDINVTDDIQIQLNVSEPRLKVGIFRGDKGMHFTEAEIKALVEVLSTI